MATPGAHLRRVAGVNAHHTAPLRFGLVLQETAPLRKRPRVQAAAGFASALLVSGADVVQVLHHNHHFIRAEAPKFRSGRKRE